VILPTKGIPARQALLTVGGQVVDLVTEPMTVSRVWAQLRAHREESGEGQIGFDWFVLALDLARSLGAIGLTEDGFLVRTR
jgi:hypothetical protein